MKKVIEDLAQDVDILDKVHAKPGEVFKMQMDLSFDSDDDLSRSSKSDRSSRETSRSQKSALGIMGDRTRRKALEGEGEIPQRVRAYLPKKYSKVTTQLKVSKLPQESLKPLKRIRHGLGTYFSD